MISRIKVISRKSSTAEPSRDWKSRAAAAAVLIVTLGGCTIRPVQEDVTRIPTSDIVNYIRCEARFAVLEKATVQIRKAARLKREMAAHKPQLAAEKLKIDAAKLDALAEKLEKQNDGEPLDVHTIDLPTQAAVTFYNRYINTVIAYDFSFDITETNSVSGVADPIRLISGGMVNGGLSASNDLTRNNVRTFKLSDTFKELLENPALHCNPDRISSNFVYPIAGTIGVADIIFNFIDLYEVRPLEGAPAKAGASPENALADALQFTTELKGAAKPTVQIAAVGNGTGFGPTTTAGVSASRKDIHKVTIGLAIGSVGDAKFVIGSKGEALLVRRRPGESPSAAGNRVRAFKAIDDQRINNFLDRAGALLR